MKNSYIEKPISLIHNKKLIIIIVILGISLRIFVSFLGNNYDFESYLVVAKLMDEGLNIYGNTNRYNYGPIWFNIINLFYFVTGRNEIAFRYLLIIFLSLIDLGIFAIIREKLGNLPACLFFLNPISIIITGYHNQFDNFSIFLGLLSILIIDDSFDKPIDFRKFIGLFILGLSLIVKHVLFLFPLWLAIKQKKVNQKLLTMFIPYIMFIISFIPYWNEGKDGIINNVFLYNSWNYELFYIFIIPKLFQTILSSRSTWILILIIFGFVSRKHKSIDSLLLYSAVLVAASPSITNQYLAITIPFIATNINPFNILFTIIGTCHLFVDENGLNVIELKEIINISRVDFYFLLIIMLWLGIIFSIWEHKIFDFLHTLLGKVTQEIHIQLGLRDKN